MGYEGLWLSHADRKALSSAAVRGQNMGFGVTAYVA